MSNKSGKTYPYWTVVCGVALILFLLSFSIIDSKIGYRIVFSIGGMTAFYLIHIISYSLSKSLAESGKCKTLSALLIFIYYICAAGSFLIGFFAYLYFDDPQEIKAERQKHQEETNLLHKEISSLKCQNNQLQNQLQREMSSHTSNTADSPHETIYCMEAANGMTIRVPESKLDAWQDEQDRLRSETETELTDAEKKLRDRILRDIYGPKE